MNSIKQQIFPSWWIRKRLYRINNSFRESRKEYPPVKSRNRHYRWSMTYGRSRNKLMYRYAIYTSKKDIEANSWHLYLSDQLQKVHRRYAHIYLWSLCEYENCNKVNAPDFLPERYPNSLWNFKVIEEAVDFSKRMSSETQKLIRTDNCTWDDVINIARVRFSKPERQINNDLWRYCWRANRDKLRKWHQYCSWSSRIIQNQRKIQVLIKGNKA